MNTCPRRCGPLSLCLLALLVSLAPAAFARQAAPQPIGAGLEGVYDWSRSHAFVDIIKQSRDFLKADLGTTPAALDANGWPTEDFSCLCIVDTSGLAGQEGVYKLSCVSNALPTITFANTPATISNLVRNAATGVVTADITVTAAGQKFQIIMRNTNGGARNLKILRPGYTSADTFTTPFLNHIARFSVLRYMDWARTNDSPVVRWTDRARPTAVRYQTSKGVPWETCIALANRAQKGMWINIPHMADDDYVRQLARMLRDTLNPALPIYVEYSNEVWNSVFAQCTWNIAQANAEVAAGNSPINFDGNASQFAWGWRRTANRLRQISDIFASEFGPTAIGARVRPVLAGQARQPETIRQGLKMIRAVFGPPNRYYYGIACAPYFNLGDSETVGGLSVQQVIDAMTASVNDIEQRHLFEEHAAMSRFNNLKGLAYEAGAETSSPLNIAAIQQASHDPRMRTICRDYINTWSSFGFDTLNWFVAGATDWGTQFGTFGLCENMLDVSSPKILAIDDALAAPRPPLSVGQSLPGNVDARLRVPRPANWANDPYLRFLRVGNTLDYLVTTPAAGTTQLRISAATSLSNAQVRVELNDAVVATVPVPSTGSFTTFADGPAVPLSLPQGVSVVRLVVLADNGYNINWLRFTAVGACAGDANGDGRVDYLDLNLVLSQFGLLGPGLLGDLDHDGDIDFADLMQVQSHLGIPC